MTRRSPHRARERKSVHDCPHVVYVFLLQPVLSAILRPIPGIITPFQRRRRRRRLSRNVIVFNFCPHCGTVVFSLAVFVAAAGRPIFYYTLPRAKVAHHRYDVGVMVALFLASRRMPPPTSHKRFYDFYIARCVCVCASTHVMMDVCREWRPPHSV